MKPVRYMVVLALVVGSVGFRTRRCKDVGAARVTSSRRCRPGAWEATISTCAPVRAIRDDRSIASPVGGRRFGEREGSRRSGKTVRVAHERLEERDTADGRRLGAASLG